MNRKRFFDLYRSRLDKDGKLTQREVNALDRFIDEYEKHCGYFTTDQWAYVFATAFHETAHTFEPVKEAYWLSENWRRRNLRYYPYYGRGFVQITWRENYSRYAKKLNLPLVSEPELALRFDVAFFILIDGMKNGLFTGKKLSDYINGIRTDFIQSRYVVNGRDKRELIASYANKFKYILNESI